MTIDLRPVTTADFPFFKNLHHTVLRPYIEKIWGWDTVLQAKFVKESFDKFLKNESYIITKNTNSIGIIVIEIRPQSVFLSQLLLSSEYQGKNIGTELMHSYVFEVAKKKKFPIELHVLHTNPAKRFYERLGFSVYETTADSFFMRKDKFSPLK